MTTITSSVQRAGSSSRPVAQSSDVDFDKVPSPRDSPTLSHRRSLAQSRNSGPSHLSQSTVAQDDDEEPVDFDGPDFNGGGFDSDDDDPPAQSFQQSRQHSQRRSSAHTSRRTSFTQMDQDEDEEEEQVERMTDNEPTPRAKGKRRDSGDVPEPSHDVEDDISHGLAQVDQEQFMDEDEDVPLRKRTGQDREDDDSIEKYQRPSKKAKTENEGAKKPRDRPKGSKNNVLRDGRSTRHRWLSGGSCFPFQLLPMTRTPAVYVAGVAPDTSHWNGGGVRRSCMAGENLARHMYQLSRRFVASRRRSLNR